MLGENIALSKHETFTGILVINITENSFSHNTIRIMLLYRSPSSSLTRFFNTLENLLRDRQVIDIVLDDFNLDYLNSKNVNLHEATHISGSLLAHVYANN